MAEPVEIEGEVAEDSARLPTNLPPRRRRFLLGVLPLAGGTGLVLHILADISLPLAVAAVAALGAAIWIYLILRMPPDTQRTLRKRAKAGFISGAVATACYDGVRYGTVALFSMSFQPFHVLPLFGQAFLGTDAPPGLTLVVGLLYHVSNGVCFGVAYALVFRRPGPVTGALWGVGLELFMATLYPHWLRIVALQEFLTVSAIGHLTYGVVLGLLVRRLTYTKAEP